MDVGIARTTLDKTPKATMICTPLYAAPEIASGVYGPSVDVYSFGVLVLEVFLCEPPDLDVNKRSTQVERVKD
jgi:serine/threonine protein kinase